MTVDRLVAGACAVVALGALATAAAIGGSTESLGDGLADPLGPIDDPATTDQFLALYERAERGEWWLDAQFERRRGDDIGLVSDWQQVQDGQGDQLIAAFGGLTGTYDGRVIECGELADAKALCDAGPAPDPEARFQRAIELATEVVEPRTGEYTVARVPERFIANREAECFLLRRRPGASSDLFGQEARYCFSEEAIPVLVVQQRGAVVDTRTARGVSTGVDDSDFVDLLETRAEVSPSTGVRSPS